MMRMVTMQNLVLLLLHLTVKKLKKNLSDTGVRLNNSAVLVNLKNKLSHLSANEVIDNA